MTPGAPVIAFRGVSGSGLTTIEEVESAETARAAAPGLGRDDVLKKTLELGKLDALSHLDPDVRPRDCWHG